MQQPVVWSGSCVPAWSPARSFGRQMHLYSTSTLVDCGDSGGYLLSAMLMVANGSTSIWQARRWCEALSVLAACLCSTMELHRSGAEWSGSV